MTKRKELIGAGLALIIAFISLPIMAWSQSSIDSRSSDSYSPELGAKRFGAGFYLGEPTGFTIKGYVKEKTAIAAIAAWALRDKAFTMIGDITHDFFYIPIDSKIVTLPFYAGVGGKMALKAGPRGETVAGVRLPVGVALQWIKYPIEAFAEIVPGMQVTPSTELDLMGGVGARFYF